MTQRPRPWFHRHPGLAGCGVLGVLLALPALGAAAALRWQASQPAPAAAATPPPSTVRTLRLKEHPPGMEAEVEPGDEYLSHTDGLSGEPVQLRIDPDGFIEPSRVHPEAELTILFLGGSTTECLYVPEHERFPYLVGRQLEASLGKTVNAFNGGVSGNHSMHSNFALLGKGLSLRPDVVVMMHAVNDLGTLLYEQTYWNPHPQRSLLIDPKNERELDPNDEWSHIRGKPLDYDPEAMLAQFDHSLRLFVGTCRAFDVTPVLLTQQHRFVDDPHPTLISHWTESTRGTGLTYDRVRALYFRFNERVREVAAELEVPLIDVEPAIPSESSHLYDFVHLNAAGSKLAAEVISEGLLPVVAARLTGR